MFINIVIGTGKSGDNSTFKNGIMVKILQQSFIILILCNKYQPKSFHINSEEQIGLPSSFRGAHLGHILRRSRHMKMRPKDALQN